MKIQVNKQDLVPVQHTALTKNINPKKEAVCNCCRKVYDKKQAQSVFTNYGGMVRELKYCSDNCADTVVELIGGRTSRDKSKVKLNFLY